MAWAYQAILQPERAKQDSPKALPRQERAGKEVKTAMGEYTEYGYIGPDGIEQAGDSADEAGEAE